jgi:hypothetical protein
MALHAFAEHHQVCLVSDAAEANPTPSGAPDRAAAQTPRQGRLGHLPILRESADRAFAQMLLEASGPYATSLRTRAVAARSTL